MAPPKNIKLVTHEDLLNKSYILLSSLYYRHINAFIGKSTFVRVPLNFLNVYEIFPIYFLVSIGTSENSSSVEQLISGSVIKAYGDFSEKYVTSSVASNQLIQMLVTFAFESNSGNEIRFSLDTSNYSIKNIDIWFADTA